MFLNSNVHLLKSRTSIAEIHEGYDFELEDIRPSGGGRNAGSTQFKHPPSAEGARHEEGE